MMTCFFWFLYNNNHCDVYTVVLKKRNETKINERTYPIRIDEKMKKGVARWDDKSSPDQEPVHESKKRFTKMDSERILYPLPLSSSNDGTACLWRTARRSIDRNACNHGAPQISNQAHDTRHQALWNPPPRVGPRKRGWSTHMNLTCIWIFSCFNGQKKRNSTFKPVISPWGPKQMEFFLLPKTSPGSGYAPLVLNLWSQACALRPPGVALGVVAHPHLRPISRPFW